MSVSGLFARAFSPGLTNRYTVDVIITDSSNVTTVLLSCTVDDRIDPSDTCSDASSATVPGDVYLQIRVTADSKAAPDTKWRAIFLY
jgi:hypothetical protein